MEEKRVEILTAAACGHDIRYTMPEWTHNIHPLPLSGVTRVCVCVSRLPPPLPPRQVDGL